MTAPQTNEPTSPLRQPMIEDNARKLSPASQRSHIYSCRRFAARINVLTATAEKGDIGRSREFMQQ